MTWRRAAAVLAAAAVFVGLSAIPAQAGPTPVVGLVGDSMTSGLAGRIEARLPGVDVVPLGEGGTGIDRIVEVGRRFVAAHPGSDVILWGGHKDVVSGDGAHVAPTVAAFDRDVRAGGGRLFVVSLTNRPGSGLGTVAYQELRAVNGALEAAQGSEYLDLRRWLVDKALGWLGLKPTREDRADIAEDVVPGTLRVTSGNSGHLNNTCGKPAAAYRIAVFLGAA